MKKHLLASSALVAAGCVALTSGAVAQNKPTLSVGGYLNEIVGVIINKRDNHPKTAAFDVHNDGEIHFRGNATLDNGIKFRAQAELELSEHSDTDVIDEVYVNISGSFGQLRLGQDDSVGWLMLAGYSGSWATQVGQNLSFDAGDWVDGVGAGYLLPIVALRGDPERLSYVSPRISGLQVGFTYTPNTNVHDDNLFATTDTLHNGITGAINFTGKFGETGIGGGFVYETYRGAEKEGGRSDDEKQWAVALRADFGPARVAGAYRNVTRDRRIFDVGVRYKMGANSFSLTYANGQSHKLADTKVRQTAAMLSYARQLGAGVKWHANLIHTNVGTGAKKGAGLAFSTGIGLSF